jgi:DNA-binding NtrC family response regulator
MASVLIASAPNWELSGVVSEVLRRGGYDTSEVEDCERAKHILEVSLETDPKGFSLVVICDMWEKHANNAAWLADVLTREKPDVPVVIITDESPAAPLYREAEQTGAVMVARKTLDSETFLALVEDLIPKKAEG